MTPKLKRQKESKSKFSGWEHFSHDADMGLRGFGKNKEEAFENAALAMTNIVSNTKKIIPKELVEISVENPDLELLLSDWLNGIIYEMSLRHMLFSRFVVTLEGKHLYGQMWGEKVDIHRHQPAVEIKGATYTELKVTKTPQGQWIAQCVVDV